MQETLHRGEDWHENEDLQRTSCFWKGNCPSCGGPCLSNGISSNDACKSGLENKEIALQIVAKAERPQVKKPTTTKCLCCLVSVHKVPYAMLPAGQIDGPSGPSRPSGIPLSKCLISAWFSDSSPCFFPIAHLFRSFLDFFSSAVKLEAASARMAARDRYGGWADPPQSTLQRYIRS